jgi:imidazole glycerol phosphate synthase subunit HisF
VIASGGFSKPQELAALSALGCTGASMADALHWQRTTVQEIKSQAQALGVEVRA